MFEVGKTVYFRDEDDGLRGKIGTISSLFFKDEVMVVMKVATPDGKSYKVTKVNEMANAMGLLEESYIERLMKRN